MIAIEQLQHHVLSLKGLLNGLLHCGLRALVLKIQHVSKYYCRTFNSNVFQYAGELNILGLVQPILER